MTASFCRIRLSNAPVNPPEPPVGTIALQETPPGSEPPHWAEHIRRVVDSAPPLTGEQRDRLAVLMRGADTTT